MSSLLSQWRVQLLALALVVSLVGIFWVGLSFGIDFSGGTSFQIKLAKTVTSPDEKEQIRSIIEQRLNFTGLRDATVSFVGNDIVLADIAETDPAQVQALESVLLRQGKFEATLDGELLFSGSDFQVIKDPNRGYGLRASPTGGTQWVLPFILKPDAAQRFTQMAFHQCEIISADPTAGRQYECKQTYFFIDRPQESVLVFSATVFSQDRDLLLVGNQTADIPAGSSLADLLLNANVPYVVLDSNAGLDQNASARLQELLSTNPTALVPPDLPIQTQNQLSNLGFSVKVVTLSENVAFAWQAVGARSIISLTEGVANLDPYIANVQDAKVFSELVIQGFGSTPQEAESRLESLTVLLQSGSLPIAVESVGKETISPLLGKSFLNNALWMGIVALLVVVLVVFVRYRNWHIALPLGFISLSEVILILGFAAFVRWNLDLASMAGIITAIGTGVNQQIIITDEVLQAGVQRETGSLATRTKRALFIIVASAATVLATMLPIIFFGFGLGKLVGFALTTTIGVLVGVLITRPAYSEFAKLLGSKQ